MLLISHKQMSALEKSAREATISEVAHFIARVNPALYANRTEAELRQLAGGWVVQTGKWDITEVPNICRLLEMRMQWGSFDDPASGWILAVLAGPLSEHDKLEYLHEVLYGA